MEDNAVFWKNHTFFVQNCKKAAGLIKQFFIYMFIFPFFFIFLLTKTKVQQAFTFPITLGGARNLSICQTSKCLNYETAYIDANP